MYITPQGGLVLEQLVEEVETCQKSPSGKSTFRCWPLFSEFVEGLKIRLQNYTTVEAQFLDQHPSVSHWFPSRKWAVKLFVAFFTLGWRRLGFIAPFDSLTSTWELLICVIVYRNREKFRMKTKGRQGSVVIKYVSQKAYCMHCSLGLYRSLNSCECATSIPTVLLSRQGYFL